MVYVDELFINELLIAVCFSVFLYAILFAIDKGNDCKDSRVKLVVCILYTLLCFIYGRNFITIEQSYNYITKHIEDYNLFLFKRAKMEIDPGFERFKWGIDQYLIERLNEYDYHGKEKDLIIVDRK